MENQDFKIFFNKHFKNFEDTKTIIMFMKISRIKILLIKY